MPSLIKKSRNRLSIGWYSLYIYICIYIYIDECDWQWQCLPRSRVYSPQSGTCGPRTTQSWKGTAVACTKLDSLETHDSNRLCDWMTLVIARAVLQTGQSILCPTQLDSCSAHDSGYETISFKQMQSSNRCGICCIAHRIHSRYLFWSSSSWLWDSV